MHFTGVARSSCHQGGSSRLPQPPLHRNEFGHLAPARISILITMHLFFLKTRTRTNTPGRSIPCPLARVCLTRHDETRRHAKTREHGRRTRQITRTKHRCGASPARIPQSIDRRYSAAASSGRSSGRPRRTPDATHARFSRERRPASPGSRLKRQFRAFAGCLSPARRRPASRARDKQ